MNSSSARPARLRITHVVVTNQFAGTERYAIDVATELGRRGHDVTVVGGAPASMTKLVAPPVRWRPGATTPEAVRSLVQGGRCDVVHSHLTKADFCALMAAPLIGGRRVATRHITAPRGFTPRARRLGRVVKRLLACEIAVSQFVADNLDAPVDVVLLNGVPPVEDDGSGQGLIVLVAQRLAPEKDTATALRAWAQCGLSSRGWRLVIAGDGPELSTLKRQAAALGIAESCEFPGWVPDPSALFRSAGILLAPAPAEPCGLTVLEAMAHGLPVIAARSAGHLETIGRDAKAATFEPGDDRTAAQHLVRLAGEGPCRRRYGQALQRLQTEQLSLANHVDALEEIYFGVWRERRRLARPTPA